MKGFWAAIVPVRSIGRGGIDVIRNGTSILRIDVVMKRKAIARQRSHVAGTCLPLRITYVIQFPCNTYLPKFELPSPDTRHGCTYLSVSKFKKSDVSLISHCSGDTGGWLAGATMYYRRSRLLPQIV